MADPWAKPTFQGADGQIKLGGWQQSSGMSGKTVMSPTGVFQSTNYAAGTTGFILRGDGTAEFSNVTIRGTVDSITLSSPNGFIKSQNFNSGTAGFQLKGDGTAEFNNVTIRGDLKTGAAGTQHIEILKSANPARMSLYSGNAAETTPGAMGMTDNSTYPSLTIDNAAYTSGIGQHIGLDTPGANYGRGIFLEGGKPFLGNRGVVSLQPPNLVEGRVVVRGGDLPAMGNSNISGGYSFADTLTSGAVSSTGTGPILTWISETVSVTFTVGAGNITLPNGGFPQGVVAAVASAGLAGIVVSVLATSTRTTLHLYAYDASAPGAYTGTIRVSYIALGFALS